MEAIILALVGVITTIGGAVLKYQQDKINELERRSIEQQRQNEELVRENARLEGRVQVLEGQHNVTAAALIEMTRERDYWREATRAEHSRAEAYEAQLLRSGIEVPVVAQRSEFKR